MTRTNKVHMREKNHLENNLTRKTKNHKNVSIPWSSHTTPGNTSLSVPLKKIIHKKEKAMT